MAWTTTARSLGPPPEFDKAGYIFVMQDVRGRYMSEGTFVEMRPHIDNKKSKQEVDDSTDLYDTIDWLLKMFPTTTAMPGSGVFPIRASSLRQASSIRIPR